MSDYQLTTLSNGLRIATERLPGVESVAVAVSAEVGARYEQENQGGISHLLEHMAFKGTERRSARQIAEEFDAIGGQFNAYTSLEHTVYYAKVLKERLPVAVDILADILQHSAFDEDELEREKGVVQQEISMHHDTPDDLIFDLFDEAAFPDQPLGRSILGTPEKVAAYSRDQLIEYMDMHYAPSRLVLSAAGNVDHEQLVSLAGELFVQPANDHPALPPIGHYKGGVSVTERSELEQLQLMFGFDALSLHDDDYYVLQIFSHILGGGMSSRLFQEVREKRGLAYHISSIVSAFNDCGVLSLYCATGEDQSAELPLILVDELKKMADGVTEKELQRVKNQQRAELVMARERSNTVAGWIGKHLLVYGHYRTLEEILAKIEVVTADDVQKMAGRLITCQKPTLAALGPTHKLASYDKIMERFTTV